MTLPSEGLLEAQKLEVTTNLPNFESTTWLGLHGISWPILPRLYETSSNFRSFGSEPLMAPNPIGQHMLPFLVTDPLHQVLVDSTCVALVLP